MRIKGIAALCAAVLGLCLTTSVRADTILVTFAGQAGNVWSYNVWLSFDGVLTPGATDGITFIDLQPGTVGTTAFFNVAGDWALIPNELGGVGSSVHPGQLPSNLGDVLAGLQGGDSPADPNITFLYTGLVSGIQGPPGAPLFLGQIKLTGPTPVSVTQYVGSEDSSGVGHTPMAEGPMEVPGVVPLPTAAWASFGMLGLLGIVRMRKAWL